MSVAGSNIPSLGRPKMKVLLVDTKGIRRKLRVNALTGRGVEVVCAHDITDARSLWHPGVYNLVLVDHRHDPASAVEFCDEIKATVGGQLTAFLVGKSEYLAASPRARVSSDAEPIRSNETVARLISTACEGIPRRGRFQEAIWRMSLARSSKPAQNDTRRPPILEIVTVEELPPAISFGEAVRQAELDQEAPDGTIG